MGVRQKRIAAHSLSKVFQRRLDLFPLLQDQSQAVVGGGVAGIEAKGVPVLLGRLVRTSLLPEHLPQPEAGRRARREPEAQPAAKGRRARRGPKDLQGQTERTASPARAAKLATKGHRA